MRIRKPEHGNMEKKKKKGKTRCESKQLQKEDCYPQARWKFPVVHYFIECLEESWDHTRYQLTNVSLNNKQMCVLPLWAALVEAYSPTVWAVNSTRHHQFPLFQDCIQPMQEDNASENSDWLTIGLSMEAFYAVLFQSSCVRLTPLVMPPKIQIFALQRETQKFLS